MTREEIIRLAEEAGFMRDSFGFGIWDNKELNKFADLIAAAEREACAQVCEPQSDHDDPLTAFKIATAIRARGHS